MENYEFKPVVDLERDGLHQVIPAQEMLYEQCPNNQTRLWDKSLLNEQHTSLKNLKVCLKKEQDLMMIIAVIK